MKILVVDDDRNMRQSMKRVLEIEGFDVTVAENGLSAQRLLENGVYHLAVVDLRMPGLDGMGLLRWIREEGRRLPVIVVSAYGDIDDAVSALKSGANDYIVKPFSSEEFILRIGRVLEEQKLKNLVESGVTGMKPPHVRGVSETGRGEVNERLSFLGVSSVAVKIRDIIDKISATPSTVLITGESGTGKEVVARLIHLKSSFSEGPFVAVNIGAIPETLIESELFGYERGAFTGAVNRKTGMFELASSGSLFLDEIGEMPMNLQVKLLRVLEERKIMRLGGTREIPIDVRLISATNRNLEEMVERGLFREDLYYRLNVVHLDIPPLKERREDIPVLAAHSLGMAAKRLGKRIRGFTHGAMQLLVSYDFPGNVRELENIIERACIFAEGDVISENDLSILKKTVQNGRRNKNQHPPMSLKAIEREAIVTALKRWEGNRSKAAEELGIARRTIINKIKEYGIEQ